MTMVIIMALVCLYLIVKGLWTHDAAMIMFGFCFLIPLVASFRFLQAHSELRKERK